MCPKGGKKKVKAQELFDNDPEFGRWGETSDRNEASPSPRRMIVSGRYRKKRRLKISFFVIFPEAKKKKKSSFPAQKRKCHLPFQAGEKRWQE